MAYVSKPGSQVSRVLAPLALSTRAAAVAREADRLARLLEAELILLHVGVEDSVTRTRFEDLLREHEVTPAKMLYRSGKPAKEILRAAHSFSADLIVAGALEKEGLFTYYAGRVARRVARQANCSVLLMPEPRSEPTRLRRWVVSVRYDDASRAMLRMLLDLSAREQPDRIDVVAEYELHGSGLALDGDLDSRAAEEFRDRVHREEQARLADLLAEVRFMHSGVQPVCLRGRVGYEAAQYARQIGADLLIMPAPKRLGFWDRFIRRGVETVLESLPCAVWLYRPTIGRGETTTPAEETE